MTRRRITETERLQNWNIDTIAKKNRLSYRERISQNGYKRQRLNYVLALRTGDLLHSRIGSVPIITKHQKRQNLLHRLQTSRDTFRFINSDLDSISYMVTSLEEFRSLIKQYYARVMNGERFIVTFEDRMLRDNTYILNDANYHRLMDSISLKQEGTEVQCSDSELVQYVASGLARITFRHPKARSNHLRAFTRHEGAFFPFTHTFVEEHLVTLLARLGCWTTVNPDNYSDNCLLLAFRDAGVNESTLSAMKLEFRNLSISRIKIKAIAESHGLRVTIRTEGSKNLAKYGPIDGHPVSLYLFKNNGIHHYVNLFRTDVTTYALNHHETLKHKDNWWMTTSNRSHRERDTLMSDKLLHRLMQTPHLVKIDASTQGIFRTQFHQTLDMLDCKTLEYDEGSVRPFVMGEKRDVEFAAELFFDFETVTHDDSMSDEDYTHRAFLVRWTGTSSGRAEGWNCAQNFLDRITQEFGTSINDDSLPQKKVARVRLLAHNMTYDVAFLFQHLSRINFVERGTNIICGSARYYCNEGEAVTGSNRMLLDWMRERDGRYKELKSWAAAKRFVRHHQPFLTSFEMFNAAFGEHDTVATREILRTAPWDTFEASRPFYLRKVIDLEFRDTIKMIPEPLSKFGKMFRLDQEKEVMPYELYTSSLVDNGGLLTWEEITASSKNFNDFDQLWINLHKWDCVSTVDDGEKLFDMMRYADLYCKADVDVLRKGYECFAKLTQQYFNMDARLYVTIPSMADAYFASQGCYDQVHELSGVPLQFHRDASVGGRVMCANNEPILATEDVDDLDAKSLYPSSMRRLGGFVKGPPKVWNPSIDLDTVDAYALEIYVTSVGRHLRFPTARIKDDNDRCEWTNDLVGKCLRVDKWTLQEMVKHQGIEFTIVRGYYYDEGRNYKIGSVIQELYDLRAKYKREKNPIQEVVKLFMNSGYGKTGLRPIETEVVYKRNKDDYIDLHYNHIRDFTQLPNGEWRFNVHKQIETHFNRQQVAMEILSMSKVIMNEPMVLAEDLGIEIHYQDTDSMHLPSEHTSRLITEFRKKYGRELIGNQLGEFETDFSFEDAWHFINGRYEKVGSGGVHENVRAVRSIFLGKKSYLDVLQDKQGNVAYHIRMKSIPSKCLLEHVAKCFRDPLEFYMHLYNGNPQKINLNTAGNCCFRTGKDHLIRSLHKFERTIHFPIELKLDHTFTR